MTASDKDRTTLVIVSGLSGAGKSVAISALEDIGYYCMDNIPLPLVEDAVGVALESSPSLRHRYAVGIDIRSISNTELFREMLEQCRAMFDTKLVFLTAEDQPLITRYSTTRRKHPLLDVGGEVTSAIRRERAAMQAIEGLSDLVIDTSYLSPHELTRTVEERFGDEEYRRFLDVTFLSFGFKHGLLRPVDTVFDLRCLPNPFYRTELRDLTGLDKSVSEFVLGSDEGLKFMNHVEDFLSFSLPLYGAEGKHYFRVGFGCTGGQHRSVAMAEAIAERIARASFKNIKVSVLHRDLNLFERKDLQSTRSA